jgi:putative membrane protein
MAMTAQRMTDSDHGKISAAVHAAEAQTSGEIVTIIADHSDRYLDIALWWSILVAILGLAALAIIPDFYMGIVNSIFGKWNPVWSPREYFEVALAVAVIKFCVMRLLLQWIPLRMFLTPALIKSHRTHRRAIRYFKVGAERRTAGRTGILIYLSLTEHRAEIVADESIHAKVPNELWGEAMADMLVHIRYGRIADGMVAAVEDVGKILSEHFPRSDDDVNELPDRVIEL